MRVLTVSSLFHPHLLGGAEASATNLATWLAAHGDEVHVLTSANSPGEQVSAQAWRGVNIWRRYFPRPYPVSGFTSAASWKKPLWHVQDMLDPRNRRIVAEVLDAVKPDVAIVHFIPGIGFNALNELAARRIPMVYYLHDLGLACVKMSMFKNGRDCERQCRICKVTSSYKRSILSRFQRIGFCSPSRANLEHLQKFFPVEARPSTSIPNANQYPAPTVARAASPHVRFLYAGRVHAQKGVALALEVLKALSSRFEFSLRVVGGGQEEAALREAYAGEAWCSFTGHIAQVEVSNEMLNADVLLLPSVWLENSPGVVVQALGIGLPVIGSNKGGIPELVTHGENGMLVAAGDKAAWIEAIAGVLEAPAMLAAWRASALREAERFRQDALGERHRAFAKRVVAINEPDEAAG